MISWAISCSDTFLNELLNLPKAVQKKTTKALKILEQDPISAQGDAKKLKGYTNNIYRVRIGDYRLFYSFGQGWVKVLSVRKRDERTYTIDLVGLDPPATPPDLTPLTPQHQPDSHKAPAEIAPTVPHLTPAPKPTSVQTALPFTLTEALLQQWQIPTNYWPQILTAPHCEALLELPIPDQYLGRIIDNLYPRPLEGIISDRAYILKKTEDLERFVEGKLTSFLLKLDPEQERLKNFGKNGPVLVKGGPGTGKSTLAIYRVQKLLEQGYTSVLFTTYTKGHLD